MNTLRKILFLSILITIGIISSCNEEKKFDHKYDYVLGKWKCGYNSETWIDSNYIFNVSDDWSNVSTYEIKDDSLAVTYMGMTKANSIKKISFDTVMFGTEKYYRVVKEIPKIDTSKAFQLAAEREMVIRRTKMLEQQKVK